MHLQGAELNPLIARCSVMSPYYVPLLRAARDDVLTVLHPIRGARLNPRKLRRMREPMILLLDDCEPRSTGPNGWIGIRHARDWAHYLWIHPSGADDAHAAGAVEIAAEWRRLLLIRTTDEHLPAWARWFGREAGPIEEWHIPHALAARETLQ